MGRPNGSSGLAISRWVNACCRFRSAAASSVTRLCGVLCMLTLSSAVYLSSRAHVDRRRMLLLTSCSLYGPFQVKPPAESLDCQTVFYKRPDSFRNVVASILHSWQALFAFLHLRCTDKYVRTLYSVIPRLKTLC